MIASDGPAENFRSVEVVHREDGAPLILIADEGEALGLPRLLITRHVDVYDLAELRGYHDHIALAQPVAQPTNIDIGAVLMLRVPGLVDVPHASVADSVGRQLELQVLGIDAFDVFDGVHLLENERLAERPARS